MHNGASLCTPHLHAERALLLQLITLASEDSNRLRAIEQVASHDVLALRSELRIIDGNLTSPSQDAKGAVCRLLNAIASYKIGLCCAHSLVPRL